MDVTGAALEAISGEMAGQKFNLGEVETSIGRGPDNDIVVRDPTASRHHAVIRFYANNYTLVDLGSTSGTRLNGKRIQSTRLEDGDTVTIGETNFRFQREVDIESAATVMADEDSIPTMLDSPIVAGAAIPKPPPAQPVVPPPAPAEPRATPAAPAPSPPVVPPPASPRIGDAGVITEDGLLEKLPMKCIGIGCGALVVISLCIIGAVLGFRLLSPEEVEPAPVIYQTATLPPEPTAITTEEAGEPLPEASPTSGEGGEPVTTPAATPEGTQAPGGPIIGGGTGEIAYASDVNGIPQIFLANIGGIELRQLTDLSDGACQPTWSPDGLRMAFISPCGGNQSEYPGSSLYMITFETSGEILGPSSLPSVLGGGDFDPAWSPEGARLVFTSLRTSRPQIFRMNLDGTNLQRLTSELTYNWEPTWSPDGGKVAFMTTRQGVDEVWTVFSEGGSESRFSLGDTKAAAHPDWSPDGSTILFEKVVGAIPRLVGAPVADGGVRKVLVCQSGDLAVQPMSEPAWSPDGLWMAFETWPDGENHNIAIMSNNCSNYQEISTNPAEEFDAAWRPGPE